MPKTAVQRAAESRTRQAVKGLKRLEVSAYPEDHPAIKAKAASLTRSREKRKKEEK